MKTDPFSITLLGEDGYYDSEHPFMCFEYELPHRGVTIPLRIHANGGTYERDDSPGRDCSEIVYRRVC